MKTINRFSLSAVLAACSCLLMQTGCSPKAPSMPESTPESGGPVVNAAAGPVEGIDEGSIRFFKGIPYVQPPVGDLRWKPPQELPSWSETRKSTEFGPACIQPGVLYSTLYSSDMSPFSEDCLTLNVWAPENASDAPVMVWIHGGALVRGSSKEAVYDGAAWAKRGIVVVSINYRLGVLGYLSHPDLSAESALGISGNYGLLDQIAALKWIKNNIAAFGGNPENVTIAGESAGALSVMFLLSAPDAHGLFDRAIVQSGYMVSMPEIRESRYGTPSAETIGLELAKQLGSPAIADLREVDAATLVDNVSKLPYLTLGTVDGKVLPRQMVDIFDRGEQAPVPIMVGFNSGEIRSLRVLAPPVPESAAVYEDTIQERYLDLADEFLRLYPSSDMQESIWATTRDALYGWTSERIARKQTELGQPAFLYLFDHGYPAADEAGLHAFHASELPYAFGTMDRTPPNWPKIPNNPEESAFSEAMIDYWTSFAATGSPRAQSGANWEAYGSSQDYMHFLATPQMAKRIFPGMYELHEAAVCRRKASDSDPWNWNTGIISPVLTPMPTAGC